MRYSRMEVERILRLEISQWEAEVDETWNMNGKYRVYSLDRTKWVDILFEKDDIKERVIIQANLPIIVRDEESKHDDERTN